MHVNIKVMYFLSSKCKWISVCYSLSPYDPKNFFWPDEIFGLLSKMPQKCLDLVKTPTL